MQSNTSTRCVYFHIRPQSFDREHLHLPMELLLLADHRPVRHLYRLYGSFATERILLSSGEHTLTLRLPDGTPLRSLRLPAGDHSYMITLSEPDDFAIVQAGPMAPTPDAGEPDKLAGLLTAKLTRILNPASPLCLLYKHLTERELDHIWFEFWETALLIRFMPKSGRIPDLKKDFDMVERYDRVLGGVPLSFPQTLELEARIAKALSEDEALRSLQFFRNDQGFLSVRAK